MPGIKLHLTDEEYAAVSRKADELKVSLEDIAYAGLDCIMSRIREPDTYRSIVETRAWRPDNLPTWSDSAHSVHAYEAKPDDYPRARV